MPQKKITSSRTEIENWHSLHGPEPECKAALEEVKRRFEEFFPAGHEATIRDWVELAYKLTQEEDGLKDPFKHLADVHPDAWDLILKHGQDFRPISWDLMKPWEWEQQPIAGHCFRNATDFIVDHGLAAEDKASYVEGICLGPLVKPILHSWVKHADTNRSLDWTFYSISDFILYYGVAFTCAEYDFINQNAEGGITVRMLFRRDCFPKVAERVLEVLSRR